MNKRIEELVQITEQLDETNPLRLAQVIKYEADRSAIPKPCHIITKIGKGHHTEAITFPK